MFCRPVLNWILITCSLICAGLIALSFESIQSGLDRFVEDGTAEFFSRDVHLRFRIIVGIYGLAFFYTALMGLRSTSLVATDPGNFSKVSKSGLQLCRYDRAFWIAVFVCVLLAVVVRLLYLTQPMRYDEAYTYNTYISRGILAAVSTYESPNNHLLNTVLSWGAVKVFGNTPASLRLPALMAGILCVVTTMMLAYRIAGSRAAILAGMLVALSSPLIEYSTNARGYTLMSLFTLLAWISALDMIRHDRLITRWILAMSVGFGIAAIPLMLLPLLMLGTWLGCLTWRSRERARILRQYLPSLLGGGLIAFVMYSPILIVTGPVELIANSSGQKLGRQQLIGNIRESIEQAGELLFRDIPWPILTFIILGVCLFIWRLTPLFRYGRVTALISTIACCLPLVLLDSRPPARVWLFLLPLLYVAFSCGVSGLLTSIKSRLMLDGLTSIFVVVAAVWPFVNTAVHGSILNSSETGAFSEAEVILKELLPSLKESDRIYAAGPSHAQLVYYGEKMGINRHQFPNLSGNAITSGSLLIFPSEIGESIEESLQKLFPSLTPQSLSPIHLSTKSKVFLVHNAQ